MTVKEEQEDNNQEETATAPVEKPEESSKSAQGQQPQELSVKNDEGPAWVGSASLHETNSDEHAGNGASATANTTTTPDDVVEETTTTTMDDPALAARQHQQQHQPSKPNVVEKVLGPGAAAVSNRLLRSSLASSIVRSVPNVPFFNPPRQRQRWGEPQGHPHKNWSEVFFDLFYVAAAYNLGNLLREDPTSQGILYLTGCFLPLVSFWQTKLYHDARYTPAGDDVWHRLYEIASLVPTATAVLHIRPVAQLSRPAQYSEMFALAASITGGWIMSLGRMLEIMYCQKYLPQNQQPEKDSENKNGETQQHHPDGVADDHHEHHHHGDDHGHGHHDDHHSGPGLYPEAFISAKRDFLMYLLPCLVSAAATIYSALEYYHGDDGNDKSSTYGYDDSSSSKYDADSDKYGSSKNETDHAGDKDHLRFLADDYSSSSSSYEEDNLPIILLLVAGILPTFFFGLLVIKWKVWPVDHTAISIPMNIEFAIHRYGEFVMVMLGETVLSLLIVDIVEVPDYFATFFTGVIAIILLEYLHFRSQTHNPDEHAMRRSMYAAFSFWTLMIIYSTVLITLGASYKMFLFEFVYKEDAKEKESSGGGDAGDAYYGDEDDHRRFLFSPLSPSSRFLAGGESAALRFDTEDRQQRIANIFCGSLALVWFCLDAMTLAHRGQENLLKAAGGDQFAIKPSALLLAFLRVGMIVWIATLSQYETDPKHLSFWGLAGILAQLALRVMGFYVCPPDSDEAELEAIEKTLQYTTARLRGPADSVQGESTRASS